MHWGSFLAGAATMLVLSLLFTLFLVATSKAWDEVWEEDDLP